MLDTSYWGLSSWIRRMAEGEYAVLGIVNTRFLVKTWRTMMIEFSSDKVERLGDWNSLEYQDTTISIGKKVMNALNFYRMETDEISERYIAPCFVNSLEAFDGEVNLKFDENLILNEFAVKLCLDYEVKKGKKLVKKKLIVALKGQLLLL
ncbi:hypothetical protein Tco_1500206 [Tanacetum coccineum]